MQLRRLQMLCLSSAALAALLYALTRCSGAPAMQLAGGLAADDAQPNATLVEICMKLAASPSADALSALPLSDQLAAVQAVETALVTAASVQHVVSAGAVPRNDFPHDKFGDQYLAMVLVIKVIRRRPPCMRMLPQNLQPAARPEYALLNGNCVANLR